VSATVIDRAHHLLVDAHAAITAMHDIAAMHGFPVFIGPSFDAANKIAEAMNLLFDLIPANDDRPSGGEAA
jgi:hypothetical protein